MWSFLKEKGGQYLAVLLLALSLNFFLPRWMPGSPLLYLAGEDVASLSPAELQELMARHGLDRPLLEQFWHYLLQLAQGDLGYSYRQQRPVGELIRERLPWTLLLAGTGLVLSTLVGVVLGAAAAWRRGRGSDVGALLFVIFLDSLPSFWVGMMLVAIFAATLKWFPVYGAVTPWQTLTGWAKVKDIAWHLVLPLTTLVIVSVPGTYMVMRSSLLTVLGEDYILMARAKGLRESAVLFRHALRNALLPVATVFILNMGYVVGGATVIETVFSYPGIGRLIYEAVLARDYPVMQAGFLVITVCVLAANLVADLLYPLLDPRVARGGGHRA